MYRTLVFAVFFVLMFDVSVVISKPLSEDEDDLKVDGLFAAKKILPSQDSGGKAYIVLQNQQDPDTKKHYYLLKVKEYYDFLPYSLERVEDRHLRLEVADITDSDFLSYYDLSRLVKRDISDFVEENREEHENQPGKRDLKEDRHLRLPHIVKRENREEHENQPGKRDLRNIANNINRDITDFLEENVDVLQESFVKRDTTNNRVKRDINLQDNDVSSGDPDDPNNNNYRYIAYIPFFRVRKYYVERKKLDFGL